MNNINRYANTLVGGAQRFYRAGWLMAVGCRVAGIAYHHHRLRGPTLFFFPTYLPLPEGAGQGRLLH